MYTSINSDDPTCNKGLRVDIRMRRSLIFCKRWLQTGFPFLLPPHKRTHLCDNNTSDARGGGGSNLFAKERTQRKIYGSRYLQRGRKGLSMCACQNKGAHIKLLQCEIYMRPLINMSCYYFLVSAIKGVPGLYESQISLKV
jgi:hypothetical protein